MANTVENLGQLRIEGLKEIEDALRQLPEKIQQRVINGALFAGAKLIKDAVIANAPEDTGFLKRNVIAYRSRDKSEPLTVVVGIRKRLKKIRDKSTGERRFKEVSRHAGYDKTGRLRNMSAFYYRYLEKGTSRMPAKPFIRPAFDANKEAAVARFKDRFAAGLLREQRKLGLRN